jgi:CheY-like chemotaxis protein/HPt (histidine-containing phosphotransfer) domain-containing protein
MPTVNDLPSAKETPVAEVLVVEDEDTTRLLLEARLVEAGHVVRPASSMEEAQAVLAQAGPPEVLVSDMFMPGGSGLSLVAALRREPACADLSVIFLSGRALPGDVDAGRAMGATYLTKPLSVPALLRAIDAALAGRDAALARQVLQQLGDLGDVDSGNVAVGPLALRVLSLFVEQAPAARAAVEGALAYADAEALEATTHRLGGAAANLGAGPLAQVCGRLEEHARSGRFPVPAPLTATLRRELATTCRVFGSLVASSAGPEASWQD